MNVKALLHDSPSDLHRRPRHDSTDNNSQWPQRQPPSPPRRPSHPPSAQPPPSTHPSPAMASLRLMDSPRLAMDPSPSHSANPAAATPVTGVGRRIPTPTPLTAPSSVTGHGVWSPDRNSGSDFLKERDLRDWERVQRDQRDQRRDQLRDRERPGLHPPLPPPLPAFGDPLRRKNIAMEVNGPLAGPGIPSPDDLAARSHPSASSSRRPSISNSTIDVGKKMASPTEDEIRGREPQQRLQEIQLKERPVREPSRERERENWENDHGYQRNGPRKIIKAYNPYAPEQTRDYRYINSGLDGPGIPPSGDYRGPYRMQPPGQPPPPQPHSSMRDGRTTPKAEIVSLNRSNATGPPVTTSERDRERDSGPGPLLNERDRERDRERMERDRERERERMERERNVLHSQYGDRDREWEREHGMHMGYPDSDRERGPPPPMPPHSSHPSLPPPSLPHGHGSHPHLSHSHSHSHGQSHHHQHHSQHREQGSQSHSHHGVTHHRPSSSGPHHHQPPGSHRGPPHPHGHSSSRHPPQSIHHPQPQPPGQIQLLPHPQQQHPHGHVSHPHSHSQSHSHPHPSQPPPSHPPSSQPHSPHAIHMHGPPPSQPHPAYRSQPPSQPSAPGPLGGEMSPHHHHHHHHLPTPPSNISTHHHPAPAPPPQRQFQTQFHTQFIPGIPQPGSRMGSPVPGSMPHQQQQQPRVQAPPQSQGGPPSTGGPPPSQQQLPPSGSKSVGSGLPGLDTIDANNNVAAKRDSPHSGKRALAGIKTGDKERDGPVPLDKSGSQRSYVDVDEVEVVEDAENDVGQVALTDSEESEEEREFKANLQVNLGTFVYPRLPFPYFFDLGRGIPVRAEKDGDGESERKQDEAVEQDTEKADQSSVEAKSIEKNEDNKDVQENGVAVDKRDDVMDVDDKEKDKSGGPKEDKDLLDLETRVTVIIPNRHIPFERPQRPRLWGGGLLERSQDSGRDAKADSRVDSKRIRTGKHGQPEFPMNSDKQVATAQKRRRRIYTDDSDLFLCALHSGWLTWSGAGQAKAHGKDMKLDLRVIRCCGAPGGARLVESVTGREEVVGRFLGGYGEKCFNDAGKVQRPKDQGENENKKKGKEREEDDNKDGDRQPDAAEAEDSAEDDASDSDDDGRGLKSAAWGSSHDGSAIEVLGVEFLEKTAARTSSSLGLRNRAQRMWEYSERRMAILGFSASNVRGPLTRLAGRKRRRACDWQLSYPRRLPNATILDPVPECEDEDRGLAIDDDYPEEQIRMSVHTVMFGIGKISSGFKYVPSVLQDVLFPGASTLDCQPPPKKRRKVDNSADVEMADAQPTPKQTPRNPPKSIVLLTESEQYLLSPCMAEQAAGGDLIKYDVSLLPSCSSRTPGSTAATTVTNGDGQAPELKTDIKPLKSGVGQPSFRFLREEIVIEEDLTIRISRWRWGPSSVAN